jgi:type II secretory pathway component GspD/PulD (secretin)
MFMRLPTSAGSFWRCLLLVFAAAVSTVACATDRTTQVSISQPARLESESIRLNFEQVDLRVLLRVIADSAGRKLRLGPGVEGIVDAHYAAPWAEVLKQVARRHGLQFELQGNEILVTKAGK